ncbi:MAG: tetratricopeptide repeat protein, partial [Cytophagaceae bacterium]
MMASYKEGLELSAKLKRFTMAGRIYIRIGLYHHGYANYALAEQNYLKAVDEFKKDKNLREEAGVYTNLGALYFSILDNIKALEANERAITLLTKLGVEDLSNLYYNTANIYKLQGRYADAVYFTNKALPFFIKNGERSLGVYVANQVLGEIYLDVPKGQWKELGIVDNADRMKKASGYLNRALWATKNTNGEYDMANASQAGDIHISLGTLAMQNNDLNLAESSFKLALKTGEDINDQSNIGNAYLALGKLKYQKKDLANAISDLNLAAQIAEKENDLSSKLDIYDYLSRAYEATGEYTKALEAF